VRRAAITTLSTVAGVVLLLSLKPHESTLPAASAPRSAASPSAGSASGGRTGTFTGEVVDTRYGPVQVAATLDKGRLTAVEVLQAPSGSPRDRETSSYAVPQLTEEALSAQSADIDTVSGATYTSRGYIRSLQSALDEAGV
jgi:uncharacterized protein with FMN-binding domain